MRDWFHDNHATGAGVYGCSKGNDSDHICYQNFQNAASLLWIAEMSSANGTTAESA